ncbi:hypothetical protein TD95_003227 [Thielaviopsis punctulata]|uniref:Uncharacterized protein n=1 Tax=Thielaviopsis punctulata TaxID=72032 RepID=A0A0F4ZE46_9PEZI|nr:hypothetical protein TD95_003227 [Thielaviopsis punctulata]
MAAEQRKLLEQLMGASSSRSAQLNIRDPKVCRSYIVGNCPHDLFTNTKQDLGPCTRVHSENLKADYEALPPREKQSLGFEYDYMRDLQKYIDSCNVRIDQAQRRLEKTADEIRQTNNLLKSIAGLSNNIHNGHMEVEILGELGDVHRAIDELYRVRQYAQAKADREKDLRDLSETSGPSGHQKLQVCDVCGAYLSRLDNDRRLADHFYGKMHLGYAQMRKAYEAFPKEMRSRTRGGGGGGGGGGDDEYGSRGPRGGGGGYKGGRNRSRW